ncbi:N-(5'-phosphoribosyl)anthranilate isomerase [Tateyamaria pelophila]|uniref:N-(5'-phosphoribosyl)anthranilate isomerase n=1 Tax=Tateyamaria pelophila TaxID=328415 RepID=UPI001CBDB1E7|nr:N-(5'-phosphoribosyl)anthranilate isomerase [Tateyamaria pelophila]
MMKNDPSNPPVHPWIQQLFGTKAARKGAVVRRSTAWVYREVGRDIFEAEVKRRGYHLLQTADQYVIICHNGPVRMLF